jgi:hypothetical protein
MREYTADMRPRASRVPADNHLDFETVREEIDNLLESLRNKIEREWPKGRGSEDSAYIVWGQVRLAIATFKALRYLCAEKPADFNRKPEFVLAAAPLVRCICDALANVVYLFDDLDSRTSEFLRGGWREDYEHVERDRKRIAGREGADAYIIELERRLAAVKMAFNISDTVSPSSVPFWPIIGQMKRGGKISERRKEFLQFLEDWFYKDLSSPAHLSGPGIYERTRLLLKPHHKFDEDDRDELALYRSQVISEALLLLLCLAAEVEIDVRLGLHERIVRLWVRINHYMPDFKEVYDRWYADRLILGSTA